MAKLEDRIEFLHTKFSGKPLDRSSAWWSGLTSAIDLRNKLTHAKNVPEVTENSVRSAMQAIIDGLEILYRGFTSGAFRQAARACNLG